MKLIISSIPSFYKINLYNRINLRERIFVIFLNREEESRNQDFYSGLLRFPHVFLTGCFLSKLKKIASVIYSAKYKEIIVSGWDSFFYWFPSLLQRNTVHSVVVESSIYESKRSSLRQWIKKVFLIPISKAYVCGEPHKRLIESLHFRGDIIITRGVGVFNHVRQPVFEERTIVLKFLFVGRLIPVKNLKWLICQFARHPEISLSIIGFGEMEEELRLSAPKNVSFLGAIDNNDLFVYYQQADVFILPSISETWGLVVEEALNNGTPVMVSDRVGCAEDFAQKYGVVFSISESDFDAKLEIIRNPVFYNDLRRRICGLDFDKLDDEQVQCYLS